MMDNVEICFINKCASVLSKSRSQFTLYGSKKTGQIELWGPVVLWSPDDKFNEIKRWRSVDDAINGGLISSIYTEVRRLNPNSKDMEWIEKIYRMLNPTTSLAEIMLRTVIEEG